MYQRAFSQLWKSNNESRSEKRNSRDDTSKRISCLEVPLPLIQPCGVKTRRGGAALTKPSRPYVNGRQCPDSRASILYKHLVQLFSLSIRGRRPISGQSRCAPAVLLLLMADRLRPRAWDERSVTPFRDRLSIFSPDRELNSGDSSAVVSYSRPREIG